MPPHSRPAFARAFTLIELLVVIAIIALLVSLLLPTLSAARQSAMTVKCAVNLRTVGMGFSYYAETYRDYFPTVSANDRSWQHRLGQGGFLGTERRIDMTSVTAPHTAITSAVTWPALECPSEQGSSRIGGATYYRYRGTGTSFSANWYLSRYGYGKPRPGWSRGADAPAYRHKPAIAGIVMDTTANVGGWTLNHYQTQPDKTTGLDFEYARYAFRHQGSANRLFMDGHVKSSKHVTESGKLIQQVLYMKDAPSPH